MVSGWDKTPWMVGGGIEHSVNVCRLVSYVAAGGQQGIVGPLDLEVLPRSVAAGSVRVVPGAANVLARGLPYESYAARLPIEDIVTIAPTSSQPRTDLIVATVANPFLQNNPMNYPVPTAAQIAAGEFQFAFTEVISGIGRPGVDPTDAEIAAAIGPNRSCIPLAALVLPANTVNVVRGMIVDKRALSQPMSRHDMDTPKTAGAVRLDGAGWKNIITTSVLVPAWASKFNARGIMSGGVFEANNALGESRLTFGENIGNGDPYPYDESTTQLKDRATLMCVVRNKSVPVNARGKVITITMQGRKTQGQDMLFNASAAGSIDIAFESGVDSNPT